jgi:hypothetical protein
MVSTRSKAAASPAAKGGGSLTEVKLAVAVSGIFFAFSYFAVLQEDVYRKSYGRGCIS